MDVGRTLLDTQAKQLLSNLSRYIDNEQQDSDDKENSDYLPNRSSSHIKVLDLEKLSKGGTLQQQISSRYSSKDLEFKPKSYKL